MNTMKEAMDQSRQAVSGAFSMWDKVRGVPTEPIMRKYETMTSQDFAKIVQKFGPEATANFIKTMELRRMKQKSGG